MSGPPPSSGPIASGERSTRKKKDRRVGVLMDGRFLIRRLVARGGMGKIYEAEQQPLGRRVALKVMDLGYAEDLDPDFQKRFFLEASTCASLSHPNTIRVFDYGSTTEENGAETYYIVMEFIDGQTLLNVIDQAAPLDPLRVINIARQICGSLGEAHGQGVIHRDLKPSNVLLTTHGEQQDFAKVLDFGLVKLLAEDAEEMTKSGLFLGSPNYMSPEQIRSNRIDQRADLYSLGVILYMSLTGKSPFKRNSSVNVLLAQLEDDPPPFSDFIEPGSIPNSLEWLVHVLLAKKPGDRFADVFELNRALKAVEAEIRDQVPMLDLELDSAGRLLLPHAVDEAIQTVRWGPSGARLPTSSTVKKPPPVKSDPVPSDGSLVSRRIRKDPTRPAHVDRPRHRTRRRKRTALERLLGSPLFAMFLGGLVVVLLASLVWVASQFFKGEDTTVSIEPTGEAQVVEEVPELIELPLDPLPTPEPVAATPAPTRKPPPERATTPVRKPPSERESVRPTVVTKPPPDATPAPEAESEETPAPTNKPRGGDLRDPWSD
ncbi:MAG: protein kinase [Proteobacteria bacterium]|nr:protein kinase [Pseudomonadota bacterium]